MTDENKTIEKPETGRGFRRYHKARARRRKAEMDDARFSRAVFSVAGIAAAIAIGLGVMTLNGGTMDPDSAARLTEPWIGPMSQVEVFGLGFITLLGGMFFWRIRKR